MFGLATTPMNGQSFAEPVANPFSLSPSNTFINIHNLVDLDNDGDMDLLLGEYGNNYISELVYYENIGTASEPSFGSAQTSPFGLDLQSEYAIFPAVADLDADGDLDILATGYKYNYYAETSLFMVYYENVGTASNPEFSAEGGNFPFGTSSLSNEYYVAPVLADLDADGDMDLIVGTYYNNGFSYLENIGTPSEPEFAAPQPNAFGLVFPPLTEVYLGIPTVADLDADGDIDLICGIVGYAYVGANYYENGIYYFENTGSATNPQFQVSERNPLGITVSPLAYNELLIPALADLDNDGDVDMLCTSFYDNFFYYENTDNPVSTITPEANFSVNISPNPTNNYLNINSDEPLSQIEIYDLFGRQILTYNGQETQISLENLSSGTYIIRLINQEGEYLSKRIEKL